MDVELINRFFLNTKVVDGHWLFAGPLHKQGYGFPSIKNKNRYLHRVSICIFLGREYEDKSFTANHIPSCKFKNCWNPLHLYEGTYSQNNEDSPKTHCCRGHEFIEGSYKLDSEGSRVCLACRKRYESFRIRKCKNGRKTELTNQSKILRGD